MGRPDRPAEHVGNLEDDAYDENRKERGYESEHVDGREPEDQRDRHENKHHAHEHPSENQAVERLGGTRARSAVQKKACAGIRQPETTAEEKTEQHVQGHAFV